MFRESCSRAISCPKLSTKPVRVVFLAPSGPLIGGKGLLKWHHFGIFFKSDMLMQCMPSDGAWRKAKISSLAAMIAIRVRRQFWMWAEAQDGLVSGTLTALVMERRILNDASSSSSMM